LSALLLLPFFGTSKKEGLRNFLLIPSYSSEVSIMYFLFLGITGDLGGNVSLLPGIFWKTELLLLSSFLLSGYFFFINDFF